LWLQTAPDLSGLPVKPAARNLKSRNVLGQSTKIGGSVPGGPVCLACMPGMSARISTNHQQQPTDPAPRSAALVAVGLSPCKFGILAPVLPSEKLVRNCWWPLASERCASGSAIRGCTRIHANVRMRDTKPTSLASRLRPRCRACSILRPAPPQRRWFSDVYANLVDAVTGPIAG
jgi:hypothetical protein